MVDDPSSIEDYKELMDYLNSRGEYRRLMESEDPNLQLLGLKVVTNILRKYLQDTARERNHKDHKDF